MIRKEAWSFYRTGSGVRLCWELENLKDLAVPRRPPRPPLEHDWLQATLCRAFRSFSFLEWRGAAQATPEVLLWGGRPALKFSKAVN